MLDYYHERARGGSPGSGLGAVRQLLRECEAALGGACAPAAETRCVQLGDCVFLLRPSLLRARREAAAPPLFVRLDVEQVRAATLVCTVYPHVGMASPLPTVIRLALSQAPCWAEQADAEAAAAACSASMPRLPAHALVAAALMTQALALQARSSARCSRCATPPRARTTWTPPWLLRRAAWCRPRCTACC
jgi:hypothetical protein